MVHFDTSSIPNAATVTDAVLRGYVADLNVGTDNPPRQFMAEWWSNYPISTADHTQGSVGGALSVSLTEAPAPSYDKHTNRACGGRNELGVFHSGESKASCQGRCDNLGPSCISFEFYPSMGKCQLSNSCNLEADTLQDHNSQANLYIKQGGGTGIAKGRDNDFILENVAANVNKQGYTGLRMHISGTCAGGKGVRSVEFASFENPNHPAPRLVVTYTAVGGGGDAPEEETSPFIGAEIRNTAHQSISTSGGWKPAALPAVTYDTGKLTSDATNKFTIQAAGKYLINAVVGFSGTSGGLRHSGFFKNGSVLIHRWSGPGPAGTAAEIHYSMSVLADLAAGDTIELKVLLSFSGACNLMSDGPSCTRMSIVKMD